MAVIVSFLVVATFALLLIIWINLTILVADKAEDYGRNKTTWGLWAFINCPIIVIVVLHCAGKTRKKHLKDIVEEQRLIDDMRAKRHAETMQRTHTVQPSHSYAPPNNISPHNQRMPSECKDEQSPKTINDMHRGRWR